MEQHPSIDILGLTISEPVTMLTDIILAIFCIYFFTVLKSLPGSSKAKKYFSWYFLIMAFGTFTGGVFGHGFLPYFGVWGKYPGWVATILSMFFLQLSAIEMMKSWLPKTKRLMIILSVFLVILFLILAFYLQHFSWIIYHNITAVLVIIPIFVHLYTKYKIKGTELVLFSFLLSSSIPYFQLNRIGVNKWFTYHDVCHAIMLVGLSILFYGAYIIHNRIESKKRAEN